MNSDIERATGECLGQRMVGQISCVPSFARDHAAQGVIDKLDALLKGAAKRREQAEEGDRANIKAINAYMMQAWLGCYVMTPVIMVIVWAILRG